MVVGANYHSLMLEGQGDWIEGPEGNVMLSTAVTRCTSTPSTPTQTNTYCTHYIQYCFCTCRYMCVSVPPVMLSLSLQSESLTTSHTAHYTHTNKHATHTNKHATHTHSPTYPHTHTHTHAHTHTHTPARPTS